MKNLICILFFFISIPAVLAQTQKLVAKGFITITTGQKMQFINLRFQDDMVVFFNTATNSEFTYFLKTVKIIQDADKNIIYQQAINTIAPVVENDKQAVTVQSTATVSKKSSELVFKNCNRTLLDGKKLKPDEVRNILKVNPEALRNYNSGRTLNNLGDIAIGTGIGLIVGGGISNLNSADNDATYTEDSGSNGSPAIIIAGIVVGLASIPLKIAGHSKVKESIDDYNAQSGIACKSVKPEIFAVAKANGLALVIKW